MPRKRERQENWNLIDIPDSENQLEIHHTDSPDVNEDVLEINFFKLPPSEQVKQCYRECYEATHPNTLKRGTCAACAGEVDILRDQLTQMLFTFISSISTTSTVVTLTR
ncbi:hypothetical protein BGW80DRAFT_920942 [Lactifluus volemus]|nr:hypothetical protein BGW80DRAFT_920942 [Lactifluus volemus]